MIGLTDRMSHFCLWKEHSMFKCNVTKTLIIAAALTVGITAFAAAQTVTIEGPDVTKDAYVSDGAPTTNYGTNNYIYIRERRYSLWGLLDIDISDYIGGDTVKNVQVSLYYTHSTHEDDPYELDIYLRPVLMPWTETDVTANTTDGTTPWNGGLIYASDANGYLNCGERLAGVRLVDDLQANANNDQYHVFSSPALDKYINEVITGARQHYGFIVEGGYFASVSGQNTRYYLAAKELGDETKQPKLSFEISPDYTVLSGPDETKDIRVNGPQASADVNFDEQQLNLRERGAIVELFSLIEFDLADHIANGWPVENVAISLYYYGSTGDDDDFTQVAHLRPLNIDWLETGTGAHRDAPGGNDLWLGDPVSLGGDPEVIIPSTVRDPLNWGDSLAEFTLYAESHPDNNTGQYLTFSSQTLDDYINDVIAGNVTHYGFFIDAGISQWGEGTRYYFYDSEYEVAGLRPAMTFTVDTPPDTCAEVFTKGYALSADLNQDCYVEWADFGIFASQWQECVNPTDSGCAPWPWD